MKIMMSSDAGQNGGGADCYYLCTGSSFFLVPSENKCDGPHLLSDAFKTLLGIVATSKRYNNRQSNISLDYLLQCSHQLVKKFSYVVGVPKPDVSLRWLLRFRAFRAWRAVPAIPMPVQPSRMMSMECHGCTC